MIGSSLPGNGREETKQPGGIRRARTLPSALDIAADIGDGSLLAGGGLRQSNSDEVRYRPRDRLPDGAAAAAAGGSYTSLRDLLPSPSSPSPTGSAGWPHEGEISIRNRLVKQAAYAYLQPMAPPPSPRTGRGTGWFRRSCYGDDDGEGCAGFIGERLIPAVRAALRRLWARLRGEEERRDR